MNRPRIIRGLRIVWKVACGRLCVLLAVLWVRSYWRTDYLVIVIPGTEGPAGRTIWAEGFQIGSVHASLSIYHDEHMVLESYLAEDGWELITKPPARDFGSGFSISMDD